MQKVKKFRTSLVIKADISEAFFKLGKYRLQITESNSKEGVVIINYLIQPIYLGRVELSRLFLQR